MEYRQLGKTNFRISRIGFGCWGIGGHGYGKVDDRESIHTIRHAVDLGINFFDTADVYGFGHSEKILAKALGTKKKDVVIATKFGVRWNDIGKRWKDISPEYLTIALENSLKRLEVDCISLYQIHWPDDKTKIEDVMTALLKFRDAGKIQYIGCSNFTLEQVQAAYRIGRVESYQYSYNILNRINDRKIKELANKFDMGGMVYSVLGRGLLSGKYNLNSRFGKNDTRIHDPDFIGKKFVHNLEVLEKFNQLCKTYGKSSVQTSIRWVLQNGHVDCAIVGLKTEKQVEEVMGALHWELNHDDMALIDSFCREKTTGLSRKV